MSVCLIKHILLFSLFIKKKLAHSITFWIAFERKVVRFKAATIEVSSGDFLLCGEDKWWSSSKEATHGDKEAAHEVKNQTFQQ